MKEDTRSKEQRGSTAHSSEDITLWGEAANLSADFFADLLEQPSCKRIGVCNNCGRCER